MTTGIYAITNRLNGKVYIGAAVDVEKRWRSHKALLKQNKHHSQHLQNAWNSQKGEPFSFEIIERVARDKLIVTEQKWIDHFHSYGNEGYNICPVAYSNLGAKHTGQHNQKIGDSVRRRIQEEGSWLTGRHYSQAYKQKMSESCKKAWQNQADEKILHRREMNTGISRNHGATLSEAHKTAISEGLKRAYSEGKRKTNEVFG